MYAEVGDQYRARSRIIGHPDRVGEVLEVRGEHGAPPYIVRWDDTGHDVLVFPGSDAVIDHLEHRLEHGVVQ